jgi:hypothetical protein
LAAGCASAGRAELVDPSDAGVDGVGVDACVDSDGDGVCDGDDRCPGSPDAVDSDGDTIPDGCDRCPGEDDRLDVNMNGQPDCAELEVRTIDVKRVGENYWRGWYSDSVGHTSANDNTVTGLVTGQTFRSYFVFSLEGLSATIIRDVVLELEVSTYRASEPSVLASVWDVSTPSTTIEPDSASIAVFDDLGSGIQYGTATLTAGSVSATAPVAFALSAQAAADVKAHLGADFVVGVKLESPLGYVKFSESAEPRIARIVISYLP